MKEIWKDIPDYEGLYEVSDLGKVRNKRTNRIRSLSPSGNGYVRVDLWRDKKYKSFTVHSLVLMTFVGTRPEGFQVAHNNGLRYDNRLENLRYATMIENQADRLKHGTSTVGGNNGNSKLDEDKVLKIRALASKGIAQKVLAKKYNVTTATISSIVKRKRWQHV